MEPTACTPREVLLEVRADITAHHRVGLIGRRAARQRIAALWTLATELGDDLDRPIGRDELWALHERATTVNVDRRTAESLRGVLGRHLLDAATADVADAERSPA